MRDSRRDGSIFQTDQTMRETNYTRQANLYVKSIYERAQLNPVIHGRIKKHLAVMGAAISFARNGVKFILPDGGQVIADTKFKSFPFGNIRLPFPVITLEYFEPTQCLDDLYATPAHKRIIVVQECEGDDGGQYLRIWPIWYKKDNDQWVFQDPISLPCDIRPDEVKYVDDQLHLKRACVENYTGNKYSPGDYAGELCTLLSFLSALGCSNVGIEKKPSRENVKNKNVAEAMPFDDYHILVIQQKNTNFANMGGSHRSPREHLRRGHIRQLNNGQKIWVNACIVNAGTSGTVRKAYSFHN